jgi:hypothetical protein
MGVANGDVFTALESMWKSATVSAVEEPFRYPAVRRGNQLRYGHDVGLA